MSLTEPRSPWWKLIYIAVPALITGGFSYAKSNAEAKERSQATYETIKKAVDAQAAELKTADARADELETEVKEIGEVVKRLEAKSTGTHPPIPMLGYGRAREPHHEPAPLNLPEKFEDVVQQFKDKK